MITNLGNWQRWEPIKNLHAKYIIESTEDTIEDGLSIILFVPRKYDKVKLSFKDGVYSHTVADELLRFNLIDTLSEQYGDEFYGDWTFFKIDNSPYLKNLSEQSYGVSDTRDLMHFSIIAVDFIMDIISNYEPEVSIIPYDPEEPFH